jgi:multiple antibiotic resistance protein
MVLINLSTSTLQRGLVILAIFLTSLFSYWILAASAQLIKGLGQTGINVLTRLMGLLLAVISVQFVIDGIKAAFLQTLP